MKKPNFDSVQDYLAERNYFSLGVLPTEASNPKTARLSEMLKDDFLGAIAAVKSVDQDALNALSAKAKEFAEMSQTIAKCLEAGGRIFFCGCGATGRLSLALETLWRETHPNRANSVVGFMAGGDIALVRSVENFEDMPQFGARHLMDLGFTAGDLLISSTEGGETPYVIGATEKAAEIAELSGGLKPYFTFCNPSEILIKHVERSRLILESKWIRSICIPTGPMALSGSTRLQASTVQMFGAGLALFSSVSEMEFRDRVNAFSNFYQSLKLDFLQGFVEFESGAYKANEYVNYQTNDFGITILTDTTERSPTFSLRPFENSLDPNAKSALSFLEMLDTQDSGSAWQKVLHRLPRGLDWEEYENRLSQRVALGFDFSEKGIRWRAEKVAPHAVRSIKICYFRDDNSVIFEFGSYREKILFGKLGLLERHLIIKLILNMHSLFVMGKMGRYEGNVMTWVRPSNGKLIDRTIRYVDFLLKRKNISASYESIAEKVFLERAKLPDDEPIVLNVLKHWK